MPYFQMLTFLFVCLFTYKKAISALHVQHVHCTIFTTELFLTKCSCPERLHDHLLVLGLVLFLFMYFFFSFNLPGLGPICETANC